MAKIGPSKVPGKKAGPNGSFPIGDAKHARLAIGGATRSERAGNISMSTENHIKSAARAALKSDGGKGAQPGFGGPAKAAHRVQENAYDDALHTTKNRSIGKPPAHTPPPVAGRVPPRANVGETRSGIETAMGAQADKLHKVGPRKPAPKASMGFY